VEVDKIYKAFNELEEVAKLSPEFSVFMEVCFSSSPLFPSLLFSLSLPPQ